MMRSLSKNLTIHLLLLTAIAGALLLPSISEDNAELDHGGQRLRSKLFDSRFPRSSSPRRKTRYLPICNDYPQVCKSRWSRGPDCCNGHCLNLLTSKFHCGDCGKRCKLFELCCRGKCVNPLFDNNHCGQCYKVCGYNSTCVYGFCNYA